MPMNIAPAERAAAQEILLIDTKNGSSLTRISQGADVHEFTALTGVRVVFDVTG